MPPAGLRRSRATAGRLSYWGLVGLIIFAQSEVDKALGLGFLRDLFIDAVVCLAAFVMCLWLVSYLFTRRWLQAVCAIASPFAVLAMLFTIEASGVSAIWIRAQATRPFLTTAYARARADKSGPLLEMFDLGGTNNIAGWVTQDVLIYDETDEIALPPSQRSRGWLDRAYERGDPIHFHVIDPRSKNVRLTALGGHFFLVEVRE